MIHYTVTGCSSNFNLLGFHYRNEAFVLIEAKGIFFPRLKSEIEWCHRAALNESDLNQLLTSYVHWKKLQTTFLLTLTRENVETCICDIGMDDSTIEEYNDCRK